MSIYIKKFDCFIKYSYHLPLRNILLSHRHNYFESKYRSELKIKCLPKRELLTLNKRFKNLMQILS